MWILGDTIQTIAVLPHQHRVGNREGRREAGKGLEDQDPAPVLGLPGWAVFGAASLLVGGADAALSVGAQLGPPHS